VAVADEVDAYDLLEIAALRVKKEEEDRIAEDKRKLDQIKADQLAKLSATERAKQLAIEQAQKEEEERVAAEIAESKRLEVLAKQLAEENRLREEKAQKGDLAIPLTTRHDFNANFDLNRNLSQLNQTRKLRAKPLKRTKKRRESGETKRRRRELP
jgi:hypothetical protein